jgi:hypothetical protein
VTEKFAGNPKMLEKINKFHLASLGGKEIYFLSNIYSGGTLVAQGIRSKLILNEIKYSEPLLLLYPTKEKLGNINHLFEVEIKGILELAGGQVAGEIHIPKAWIGNSNRVQFGTSWEECIIEITPYEIYQKDYLENQKEETNAKHSITFFLTENRMLRPWGIIEQSFTGEVKSEFHPRVTLNFGNGWIGTFEDHHQYAKARIEDINGDFSMSKLALNLKKENRNPLTIQDVRTISEVLDRLLLYLSLGSSQRTTWVSWASQIGTEFVEYHRLISIPQEVSRYEDSLISEMLFHSFSQHCLDYLSKKESLDLYLPLLCFISADNPSKTVESEFVSLFISLETLLHLYGERYDKTKHFETNDWENIAAHLIKAIDGIEFLNKETKTFLTDKIGLFNQTSINFLYGDFCRVMQVDNSDLWPVSGKGLSLSRIRNKLIHGNLSDDELSLSFAKIHLKWIVERCLLATMGWKNDHSADRDSLRKFNPYNEWKQYYGVKKSE